MTKNTEELHELRDEELNAVRGGLVDARDNLTVDLSVTAPSYICSTEQHHEH